MERFKRNRVALIALGGGIIGLLVGWLAIGWWLYPVRYIDADPYDLRQTHKDAYVVMVADSYSLNQDAELARKRLEGFAEGELEEIVVKLLTSEGEPERGVDPVKVQELAKLLKVGPFAPRATPAAPREEVAGVGSPLLAKLLRICGIVLLLALIAALGAIMVARFRLGREEAREGEAPAFSREARWSPGRDMEEEEAAPGHFITTYSLGDDSYDTSFSIETPSGEFMGECGVGIAEVIAEGPPDKVTAFEVWLFDKTDIRTVAKVLLSEYAYRDDALRSRLAPRGEAVLAGEGTVVALETDSLQLEAQVMELTYGRDDLPMNSFFSRLTIELKPTITRRRGIGERFAP